MENCLVVTKKLLKILNINFTDEFVENHLLSHPNYPSILSISSCLDKYKIENVVVKTNLDNFEKLPLPCITLMEDGFGSYFFILKGISNNTVEYLNSKGEIKTDSKHIFINYWSGNALLVEKHSESKEPNIYEKIKSKRITNILNTSIIIFVISWVILNLIDTSKYYQSSKFTFLILIVLIKLVGVIIGLFLIGYEVNFINPAIQTFCSNGAKVNCQSVLKSKYGNILGNEISLSILVLSYFLGTLVFISFSNFSKTSLFYSSILNFIIIPVIPISLIFQGYIIKQWCKLCLGVSILLMSENIIISFTNFHIGRFSLKALLQLCIFLIVPVVIWRHIKPLIEKEKKLTIYERNFNRLKNNVDIFKSLLLKSKPLHESPDLLGIKFTNPKSKYSVIKVCNPFCSPCAKAHPILEKLVDKGLINLQIIFALPDHGNPNGAKIVEHFLKIYNCKDKNFTKNVLKDWYNQREKDANLFIEKYKVNINSTEALKVHINLMQSWRIKEKIEYTPSIFVDGFELPKEYGVEDLENILI